VTIDYFAAPLELRLKEFRDAITDPEVAGVFCTRGGYGSAELLEFLNASRLKRPKIFCGCSDLTSVHIFLWQKLH
jgi:muramoyltetrapeptide carboxypeptidase